MEKRYKTQPLSSAKLLWWH